jgi:chemotaxis protein CheD
VPDHTTEHDLQPREFFLKPGYLVAHHEPLVVRCVLGTCVAVTLYDRGRAIGGINHFLWPRMDADEVKATVSYGDVAVRALLSVLRDMGACREDIEAQIFGGGAPPERFGRSERDLGMDNVEAARSILSRMRIPVVSEDIGGAKGRKLMYNTATNEAVVLKVDRLRASDWLDYGQDVDWDRM